MSDFKGLQEKLTFEMKNVEIYQRAFIHRSYVNENAEVHRDNERLEFLGDAVLELVVTEELFHKFPKKPEGELTALRSALVRGNTLAKVSEAIGLGEYLLLSKGEESSGGRTKSYILANLCEAFIGALYLDLGYSEAERFIKAHVLIYIDEIVDNALHVDPKTFFQEMAQEHEGVTPEYNLLKDSGPDHNKSFIMGVYINGELIAKGEGSSKQKAEIDAARNGLEAKKWEPK
jgi:ribonuclease-3